MTRGRDRLVGVLFLAIVGAAVVLLIAGYGVAVGAGALVGLVLGGLAGVAGVLWLGRGSGRSITFAGSEWSSDTSELTVARLDEMRDFAEIAGIDLGAISVVVPVLASTEAAGLVVELVSVEVHEAGLVMTLEARPRPGVSTPASMARVSLADDAGTRYRSAAHGDGLGTGRMRYLVSATPAPPRAATRLELSVERFEDPFPGGRREAAGPWTFRVDLPAGWDRGTAGGV